MVALHRGKGPLFMSPAEKTPLQHLYIGPARRWLSRACWIQQHVLEPLRSFQDKIHLLSLLLNVCLRVCFKLLSPGHLGYLCHITRRPIRARQKGPVSARFNDVKERWTDGRLGKPPPTLRAALCRDLVETSALIRLVFSLLGEGGGQVRLSMCVFNTGSNRERRRRTGRGTDESSSMAETKNLSEMTTSLHPSVNI